MKSFLVFSYMFLLIFFAMCKKQTIEVADGLKGRTPKSDSINFEHVFGHIENLNTLEEIAGIKCQKVVYTINSIKDTGYIDMNPNDLSENLDNSLAILDYIHSYKKNNNKYIFDKFIIEAHMIFNQNQLNTIIIDSIISKSYEFVDTLKSKTGVLGSANPKDNKVFNIKKEEEKLLAQHPLDKIVRLTNYRHFKKVEINNNSNHEEIYLPKPNFEFNDSSKDHAFVVTKISYNKVEYNILHNIVWKDEY